MDITKDLDSFILCDAFTKGSLVSRLLERCIAMAGAVTRGSAPASAMFSGQSDGPKEMVVFLCFAAAARGAAFVRPLGAPNVVVCKPIAGWRSAPA